MLAQPASLQSRGIEVDLVSALLDVDEQLGSSDDVFRRFRNDADVRRLLAGKLLAEPSIKRHVVTIDHDLYRRHPASASGFFAGDFSADVDFLACQHNGQEEIEVLEIYTDWVLSTNRQINLMDRLNTDPPCWVQAWQIIEQLFSRTDYPVMAHVGPWMKWRNGEAVPTILRIDSGLMLPMARRYDRWSQDHRLLAIARSE